MNARRPITKNMLARWHILHVFQFLEKIYKDLRDSSVVKTELGLVLSNLETCHTILQNGPAKATSEHDSVECAKCISESKEQIIILHEISPFISVPAVQNVLTLLDNVECYLK